MVFQCPGYHTFRFLCLKCSVVIAGHTKCDSPDIRNAIAGLYERYGLAFSSCLSVRAISFSTFILMCRDVNAIARTYETR
jgi:hypothetical protein